MEKWSAHPATVENLNFPHKNISGWLKILTCGSHCPQKLWDRSLASAVRHRYGIKNVSSGFSGLITAAGRPCRTDGGGRERRSTAWVWGFTLQLSSPAASPPPQNCRSPGVRGLLPPKPPGSLPPAQPLVLCEANRVCIKQHEPSRGSGSLR